MGLLTLKQLNRGQRGERRKQVAYDYRAGLLAQLAALWFGINSTKS